MPKTAIKKKPAKPAKALKRKPAKKVSIKKETQERMDVLTKRLQELRDTILSASKKEISSRAKGDVISMKGDEGDMSVATTDNELRITKLSGRQRTLNHIEEALQKIKDNTYGVCRECGEDIPMGRLKVLPFAVLCIPCQTNHEVSCKTETAFRDE